MHLSCLSAPKLATPRSPALNSPCFIDTTRKILAPVAAAVADLPVSSQNGSVQQHRPLRVIIAGAGIGGLVLAVALLKQGVDVKVYERDLTAIRGEGKYRGPIQVSLLCFLRKHTCKAGVPPHCNHGAACTDILFQDLVLSNFPQFDQGARSHAAAALVLQYKELPAQMSGHVRNSPTVATDSAGCAGTSVQVQSNALAALEAIDVDVCNEVLRQGCITGDRINGLCDGETGDW